MPLRSTYLNEHGTGYELVATASPGGRMDLEFYQIVCHQKPEEPSVSLSLPLAAAEDLVSTMAAAEHWAWMLAAASEDCFT